MENDDIKTNINYKLRKTQELAQLMDKRNIEKLVFSPTSLLKALRTTVWLNWHSTKTIEIFGQAWTPCWKIHWFAWRWTMDRVRRNKIWLDAVCNLYPPAEFFSTVTLSRSQRKVMSPQQAAIVLLNEVSTINRTKLMVEIFCSMMHLPLVGAALVLGNHSSGCKETFRYKNVVPADVRGNVCVTQTKWIDHRDGRKDLSHF